MKKLLAIISILMLLATISVSAIPVLIEKKPVTTGSGTYSGEIGDIKSKEWIKVGELSGTYEQKNKFYKFEGNWKITEGDYAGSTGTMQGFFGKHILLGKITITESGKKAPIIGFIGFNETALTFKGRFMSIVGPALYFKGTYI